MAQEARVEKEQYENGYQRSLETLQKWGDAYAALLVSVALIIVVSMISTMLYDIGNTFVLMLTATMFFMSLGGAWIIYKSAPFELKTYKNHKGPRERQRSKFLFVTVTPVGLVAAVFLGSTYGLGPAFLIFGLSLLPAGLYAFIDDSKVSQLDQEIATFLRSLGNVADALGTTLTAAMTKIDRRSLGCLEPYIKRLQSRLSSRITPNLCWDRFMDETGSELVHRSTRMFVDGTSLGGEPREGRPDCIGLCHEHRPTPRQAERNSYSLRLSHHTSSRGHERPSCFRPRDHDSLQHQAVVGDHRVGRAVRQRGA